MNSYCKHALHQIRVAVNSIIELVDCLEENDLQQRPTANKHSIGSYWSILRQFVERIIILLMVKIKRK